MTDKEDWDVVLYVALFFKLWFSHILIRLFWVFGFWSMNHFPEKKETIDFDSDMHESRTSGTMKID